MKRVGRHSPPAFVEPLEGRRLMHSGPVQVTAVTADNRGEAFISFNQALRASDVNSAALQVYTAGADGILANADDQRVGAALNYQASSNRIVVRAAVRADLGYRIKIVSSRLSSADGHVKLDGEFFTSTFPSGNGQAGGNFEFQTKNDKGNRPTVRISTSLGAMNITMLRDVAPLTFNNFRRYADAGNFDDSFFTRGTASIIQAGSLVLTSDGDIVEGPLRDSIVNEFNRSNIRGTLAMATEDGNPDSATNQFFFNLTNNPSLDTSNGGHAVFGEVRAGSSLAIMDAIGGLPLRDISTEVGPFPGTDISAVPIRAINDAPLNSQTDLVIIRRVAQLVKITSL